MLHHRTPSRASHAQERLMPGLLLISSSAQALWKPPSAYLSELKES